MEHAASDVIVLERRFWLEGGANPDFWQEHFSDEGVVVLEFGVFGKPETLAAMRAGEPWRSVAMDDVHEVALGPDQVVLVYRARADRDSDQNPYRAVVSSVYVRRGTGWKLVHHHQTPLT